MEMSDPTWESEVGKRWLNCETFMVCLDEVAAVRRTNYLRRSVPLQALPVGEGNTGKDAVLPGLEIVLAGREEVIEIDYLEEAHRDQVYDAIWAALKGV